MKLPLIPAFLWISLLFWITSCQSARLAQTSAYPAADSQFRPAEPATIPDETARTEVAAAQSRTEDIFAITSAATPVRFPTPAEMPVNNLPTVSEFSPAPKVQPKARRPATKVPDVARQEEPPQLDPLALITFVLSIGSAVVAFWNPGTHMLLAAVLAVLAIASGFKSVARINNRGLRGRGFVIWGVLIALGIFSGIVTVWLRLNPF